jgi:8-oxo-dGTP pyrophosphatase MutT (NUDIX family)
MKLPLSVLVVVHTAKLDVLLLERAVRGGFWQSVTGSLDAPDESFELAAARELREETGLEAAGGTLRRWNVAYTFEIYQRWRHRFGPGVTHNTEHLFSLELAERAPVTLAPREHTASAWLPWREAARKCFSWSNRDAILMIGAALVTAGCASGGGGTLAPHLEAAPTEVRECARWYQALDAEIDASGVRDAQYARLPGFPHLRVDRPLAALRDRAAQSDAALHAYAERLHELDLDARRHELQNLKAMSGETARAQSLRRARDCGVLMRGADLASAQSRAALLGAAKVPDDYSTVMRIFGLYYLTQIPFAAGVRRWEQDTREAFARAPDDARPRVRYAPPAAPAVTRGAVSGLLARATFDPLGQLLLSPRELDRLAVAYAPSFEIEVGGDYDRFGWVRWRRGSEVPQVDAAEPTVYVHPAYTRYRDQVLLQLVYTIWFSERPRRGTVDLLAGRLDGLTWRVTLAPDGAPLIYDTIHPCGCYHMFFPTERARLRPAPDPESREEWAFVPQTLPQVADGERPVVTLASGTHYVERVSLVRGPDSLVRYVLRSYDELRSLPRAAETASAFGPEGLIAGSERSERFFFWPMGIASAGTMRQWGRQATAFVGRRHFDDADLLEKRFELEL